MVTTGPSHSLTYRYDMNSWDLVRGGGRGLMNWVCFCFFLYLLSFLLYEVVLWSWGTAGCSSLSSCWVYTLQPYKVKSLSLLPLNSSCTGMWKEVPLVLSFNTHFSHSYHVPGPLLGVRLWANHCSQGVSHSSHEKPGWWFYAAKQTLVRMSHYLYITCYIHICIGGRRGIYNKRPFFRIIIQEFQVSGLS